MNPQEKAIAAKIDRMLAGKSVFMSSHQLDDAEQYHEVRSYPNPNQTGPKNYWLCWIGEFDTRENILKKL
jgi:hypothetical protein